MENEKRWWQETFNIRNKCQLSKLKFQTKSKIQMGRQNPLILSEIQNLIGYEWNVILNSFQNPILKFDIYLAFGL